MSSIFLSCKREDEAFAARLVRALEAEGLSVWWDRGPPGGEEWRAGIERALNEARCVIVLWTPASVGPEGGFVRDEAARARERGILVPVRAAPVAAPLGFGEVQSIDLAHWRGSRRDDFFKDLLALVRAKLDGREAPPAKGPARRLYRRLTAGATLAAMIAAVWGVGMNALGVQDQICRAGFLSDTCGALGLGHRPTRAERLAWQARPPGDCAVLKGFAEREGHYQAAAAARLAAATLVAGETFTPAPREALGYARASAAPFHNEEAARADALMRATQDAQTIACAPRGADERLDGVELAAPKYDCRRDPRGGHVCALDYTARCQIGVRGMVEICR
jgi:TIR domain